jgi:uncharacterized RDD family membrane protein YckC
MNDVTTGYLQHISSEESRDIMKYASLQRRAAAYVIDYAFVQPYAVLGYLFYKKVGGPVGRGIAFFIAGMALWANFYNRCILMARTGQSWGKKIAGVKLVSEETMAPMGNTRAILREGAHLMDVLSLGAGYFRPMWDRKGQTFADTICQTVAVTVEAEAPAEEGEGIGQNKEGQVLDGMSHEVGQPSQNGILPVESRSIA